MKKATRGGKTATPKKGKKKLGDEAAGNQETMKEPPPILVGEVNIRPFGKDELVKLNNELIAEIYRERRDQSNARREIDLVRSGIDNLRENLATEINKRLLALIEYDRIDPQITESLKETYEQVKYLEYDKHSAGLKLKQYVVQRRAKLIEERAIPVEQELWKRKWKCQDQLEETYINCRQNFNVSDVRDYHVTKKYKFKNEIFQKIKDINLQMKEVENRRISLIKEFLENQYLFMETETDIYWNKFENLMQKSFDEFEWTDKNYLRRLIVFEDKMLKCCDDYLKKIADTKKQIQNHNRILKEAEKQQRDIQTELAELRRKSAYIMTLKKGIILLRKQVECAKNEYETLTAGSRILQKKLKFLESSCDDYQGDLQADDECESNSVERNAEYNKEQKYQTCLKRIVKLVLKRMAQLLRDKPVRAKNEMLISLLWYMKSIGALQYELIRDVKAHNGLVEHAHKYMHDVCFKSATPMKFLSGVEYRPTTGYNFSNIFCQEVDTDSESDLEIEI